MQELPVNNPKCLGHAASDFEEISSEELQGVDLPPGHKGFGVPALYKDSSSYRDGLRPGDVILSLDGRSFRSVENLNAYIRTKPQPAITIEFFRDGRIDKLGTQLNAEQGFQGGCRTIEELRAIADFGDPYALIQARRSLNKMHWDFLGLSRLPQAHDLARVGRRQILVGLFGSSVCCVHLAPWTDPYKEIITNRLIQKTVSDNYASTLVLKPEAYSLYRQYDIDSRYPALLQMTDVGGVRAYFTVRPETNVSSLLRFLLQ